MGLPGHRRTSSHKRRRASHFALKVGNLSVCSHCKQPTVSHQACPNCGYYRGRPVLKIKSKLTAKSKAKVAKAAEPKKDKKEEKV